MTTRVRKNIQDYEVKFTPKQDERFVIFRRGVKTKNASVTIFDAGDVLISPWSPQVIHSQIEGGAGLLMRSFSSLLGLKYGTFFSGTLTFSPVFGFLP